MDWAGPKSIPAGGREPQVKGISFKSVMASLAELKGDAALDAALASLSPEQAEQLRYRVLATHWYPISLYRALFAAIVQTSAGGPELVKAIGRECTRRDLTGVHRFAFKILSPQTIFALSNRMFGSFYDTGKVETVDTRPGHARALFRGCHGFDRWMWTELVGSMDTLFEFAGAKHVRARYTEGGQDGPDADLVVLWAVSQRMSG